MMITDEEADKHFLKSIFQEKKNITSAILKNKKWGFDKDWETFAYGLALTNPQTYGLRIQNRIISDLEVQSVSAKLNRGDYLNKKGRPVEMKTSILTSDESKMHLVQIRPWQNTDYHCVVLDMRGNEIVPYAFMLTKEQMAKELFIFKATSAHGTVKANAKNKNIEKRFSINVDPEDRHFKRWMKNYKVEFDKKSELKKDNDNELPLQYQKMKTEIKKIKSDKKWGFDKDWESFIFGMSLTNPQLYGFRIQDRLMYELEMMSVKVKEDKGDFEDILGNKFECKTSLLTNSDSKFHMVQIRPWQETNYKCLVFVIRNGDFKAYAFELNHEQMSEELKLLNASAAHGTISANQKNNNIEYRFSMNVDENNPDFSRWLKKYQIDFDFNNKLDFEDILAMENANIIKNNLQKINNKSYF